MSGAPAAGLVADVTDEAGTRRLAADIAALVRPGDVLTLHGDLGAGKSAFARALIRALADDPDLEVPSPTFTLVQAYVTPGLTVSHFDLYRLGAADELVELGFEEALAGGLSLIEWPDRAEEWLPEDRLDVFIGDGEGRDGRRFSFHAGSPEWERRLAEAFAVRRLVATAGFEGGRRIRLKGDASTRRFERIETSDRTAILMVWPPFPADRPVDADGLTYEARVHQTDSLVAFIAIADTLRRAGFRAPRILAADEPARVTLIEDLGGDGIVVDGRPNAERYLVSARRLADIAVCAWPATAVTDDGRIWPLPEYDRTALLTEAALFADAYVPYRTGRPLAADARVDYLALWDRLLARFDARPRTLVLKDYHSPNILWQSEGEDPVGLIDFQDALLGPPAYDLASLITDARVDIDEVLATAMLEAYVERRRFLDPTFSARGLTDDVAVLSAQRNAKILGRFVDYAIRSGRDAHMVFLPRVRRNLEKALRDPVLAELKLWYERQGLMDP